MPFCLKTYKFLLQWRRRANEGKGNDETNACGVYWSNDICKKQRRKNTKLFPNYEKWIRHDAWIIRGRKTMSNEKRIRLKFDSLQMPLRLFLYRESFAIIWSSHVSASSNFDFHFSRVSWEWVKWKGFLIKLS